MAKNTNIERAHRRLLGTWRSNRARTLREWVFPKRLVAKKLRYIKNIFGKNTWRFTKQRCYGKFENIRWISRYDILWADEWSVVVLFKNKDGERCHHLFFDKEYFYFSAGRAGNVEYFKKVGA